VNVLASDTSSDTASKRMDQLHLQISLLLIGMSHYQRNKFADCVH
jgi:hypothetical protein